MNTFHSLFSGRPLSIKRQIEFTERLAYLLEAGISLIEGLGLIEMQVQSTRSKQTIQLLIKRIGRGESLSSSLEALHILDPFSICTIGLGETTGTLASNLRSVSIQLKKTTALQKKLMAMMTYPAIIFISTVSLSAFLVIVIFPKIRPLFSDLRVSLPFSTRVLIFLGAIPPLIIIIAIIGIILCGTGALFFYKKSIMMRWYLQKILISLPIIGTLRRDAALVDLFRMLGTLLKTGAGLQASFVIIRDVSVNLIYKNECIETAERLERGDQLSDILKHRPSFFPPDAVGFLAIGEMTGNISEICFQLSILIENTIDENIKKLSVLVEPVLMLVMGTIVGFVALAIITPIYAITQNIK